MTMEIHILLPLLFVPAKILGTMASRFGVPAVIGEIVAGFPPPSNHGSFLLLRPMVQRDTRGAEKLYSLVCCSENRRFRTWMDRILCCCLP